MRLVVGLGNPGKKYQKTRHNLGFLALDLLVKEGNWRQNRKFQSTTCRTLSTLFVKPQTFVNQSGIAVKKIVDFYRLVPEDILVIRDDIDLPEGKIRGPYNETSSGGHLGIESIRKALGSDKFYQLKIGVGRPPEGLEADQWVLKKMTGREWLGFSNLLQTYKGAQGGIAKKLENWINF